MNRKKLIWILIILAVLSIFVLSGCVEERYTWDEKGPGKDTRIPGFELPILIVSIVGWAIYKRKGEKND